jgi:hypothetical protein
MFRALHNLSLKNRVTAFTLGLLLLSVWGLTYQFSSHLRQELETTLSAQQFSDVTFIAEHIDSAVKLRFDSLALIANSITPQMIANRGQMSSFLAQRKAIFKQCTLGVFVISGSGHGIADFPHAEGRGNADFTQRDFYRQVMATGKPALSKPGFGRFVKDPRLIIAVPVFDTNKRIAGVFACVNSLIDNSLIDENVFMTRRAAGNYAVISPRDNM